MPSKFEIKRGRGGYRVNLKAGNGQVILTSELYASKSGAEKGIKSVKANAKRKAAFEERIARDGKKYFVMKARNGEVIGTSETYNSPSGSKHGIESVQRNAGGAKVDDQT